MGLTKSLDWTVPLVLPPSTPQAVLGQNWGCGKGSEQGLWSSNPQKEMAPQNPAGS